MGNYLQPVAKAPIKEMMNESIAGRKYWLMCMRLKNRISESTQPVWSKGKSSWELKVTY